MEVSLQSLREELSRAVEHCKEVTLPDIEKLILQTEKNYTAAQEEIRKTMLDLHILINDKEKKLLQKVEEVKSNKLAALDENQTLFSDLLAQISRLVTESSVSESAVQDLLSHGPILLASLSSPFPPHFSHITAHAGLGFISNVKESVTKSLSACMWVSGEDVRVGERMVVRAVGGLQPDGSFLVRRIHADRCVLWQQKMALAHISNSLCEVTQSSAPLPECGPGQLCVAQFSQDGCWYRAVVVDTPKPGVAKYFFLDYGGSEVAPMSSLYPLADCFRALPFQMIHVKLSTDSSIDFNRREMRWRFTDHTHKKNLVADILSLYEIDAAGPVYHITLEDHSQAKPFNVGRILTTSAQVKESKYTFRSRDMRFKGKTTTRTEQAIPSSDMRFKGKTTTRTEQAIPSSQTTATLSMNTATTSVVPSSQPAVSESSSNTHTQPLSTQPVTATTASSQASSDSEPTSAVTGKTTTRTEQAIPSSQTTATLSMNTATTSVVPSSQPAVSESSSTATLSMNTATTSVIPSSQPAVSESSSNTHTQPLSTQPVTATTASSQASSVPSSQPAVSESSSNTHTQPLSTQPVTATTASSQASSDSEPTSAVTKDTSQSQNSPLPPLPPLPSPSTSSPIPEDPPLQTLPHSINFQNSRSPSSQNPSLSQPTCSQNHPSQNTVSSLSQLSPSISAGKTDLDSGCDTIPSPVCSDTKPDDGSLDTIPSDSSPAAVSLDFSQQSSDCVSIPREPCEPCRGPQLKALPEPCRGPQLKALPFRQARLDVNQAKHIIFRHLRQDQLQVAAQRRRSTQQTRLGSRWTTGGNGYATNGRQGARYHSKK